MIYFMLVSGTKNKYIRDEFSVKMDNLGVLPVAAISAMASPCAWISYLECFHVCFSYAVNLIKTTMNYCYWHFDWILLYSRNIHINALAEAEPEKLSHACNSLVEPLPRYEICISLLAFVTICLVIISQWPPLSQRLLWFWWIDS